MGRDRHKKKREAREQGVSGTDRGNGQGEEDEKVSCFYCDKEFVNEQALLLHQKAVHFKCDECGRRVAGIAGLKIHYTTVHRESLERIPGAIKDREDPKVEVFGTLGIPEEFLPDSARKRQRSEQWSDSSIPPPVGWGPGIPVHGPPPRGMMMPPPRMLPIPMGPAGMIPPRMPPGASGIASGTPQFLSNPLVRAMPPPGMNMIGIPGHLVNRSGNNSNGSGTHMSGSNDKSSDSESKEKKYMCT